jgi:surface antigen
VKNIAAHTSVSPTQKFKKLNNPRHGHFIGEKMTTRFGIATIAAVSSAVLIFGNTAHAEGPNYVGNPLSLSVKGQIAITESTQVPAELPLIATQPLKPVLKLQKLQEVAAIASETNAPDIIQHPVTDASNSYAWGQCTWYAKNKRPDLPNNLGNANTWYSQAAAAGYAVGTVPKAGAVGTTTAGSFGHVVYIESVNADGTVNISEMNYAGGIGVVHTRTTKASEFTYIY